MADPPNRLSQQQPLLPSPASSQGRAWRITFAKWAGILTFFYLLGPVIFIARSTQLEAGERAWRAEERWSRIYGSALLSLLCYLPVLVFASPLAGFWASIFGGLAGWLHLPFIWGLGGTAFWLPVPSSMLLRWVLALPLTSWIALLLEALWPHTTWESKRVLSPDEQAQLATEQAAEEKKRQATLARRSRAQLTASKRPGPTRGQSRPSTGSATKSTTPAAKHTASLWDQIDWSQVPDDHPLKKAALEEAERQAAARRNAERTQWVLGQMASQETLTPPAKGTMDAEPSPSTPAPSYNWDEGEGTVRDS
jgi:hypothetical protein